MRILIEIDEVVNENEWIHLKNSLYVHDIIYKILPPEIILCEPCSELEDMSKPVSMPSQFGPTTRQEASEPTPVLRGLVVAGVGGPRGRVRRYEGFDTLGNPKYIESEEDEDSDRYGHYDDPGTPGAKQA